VSTQEELEAALRQLGEDASAVGAQLRKAKAEIQSGDPRYKVPGTDHSLPKAWFSDPGYGALWGSQFKRGL